MKRKNTVGRILTTTGAALLAMSGVTAQAGTVFGVDVQDYIVLFEGGGGKHLGINNFGTTGIWTGDIGIAGTGTLAASGPGIINGNVNFAAADTGQDNISNTSFTAGHGVNFNVAAVQTIMNNLNTLSATLGSQAGSGTSIAINTGSDQTVLAASGALVGGNRVFNVTSFNSGNGENLIIKGDGSQSVVFDINFDTQFHGNILLQDLTGKFIGDAGYAGPSPDQVLFNLYAGAALTGGDTLDANNNGNLAHPANIIYGTFLDPNGKVSFVNTRITGRIFGGDSQDMQIVSGVTLNLPNTPGPPVPDAGSTLMLLSLGLGFLGFASRKLAA